MAKTATKTPDDEDRCPNCGYCPHCGQSTKPPQIIREVVPRTYVRPWREVEGVPYKVWCGTPIGIKPEQFSISSSGSECVSRKETEC